MQLFFADCTRPASARNRRRDAARLLTTCAVVLLSAAHAAPTTADPGIDQVRAELDALRAALATDVTQLGHARERGFGLARRIAESEARQRAANEEISLKEARIEALKTEQDKLAEHTARRRDAFARTAVQRYVFALQPRIKLILSEGSIDRTSRLVSYHDYVLRQHQRELQAADDQLQRLEDNEAALRLEMNAARRLRQEQAERAERLALLDQEQRLLTAAIEQRLSDRKLRVQQLEHDEARLLELVEDLVTATDPVTPAARTPFAAGKGSLDWPVAGRVAKAPGRALRRGGARWAGVLIDGMPGDAVQAIAPGQVVFADWFRNLGKLVIIDHGDGYLSLYGNNREVVASAGDTVKAGDTIATVGSGTGEMPAGLYFELRSDGKPVDPRAWFARR